VALKPVKLPRPGVGPMNPRVSSLFGFADDTSNAGGVVVYYKGFLPDSEFHVE
jgi:hypothetical protein